MPEQMLFYEDEIDALRATIQALGGNKEVGKKLWPDKSADSAGKLLADCSNPGRSERLSPSQLLMVMRMGCEIGFHALANYFMSHAGYESPRPRDPVDEAEELMRDYIAATVQNKQNADRMEKIAQRLERARMRSVA
jgi:hypothetical protein